MTDEQIINQIKSFLDKHMPPGETMSTRSLVEDCFREPDHRDAYRVTKREATRYLACYCHRGPEQKNTFRGGSDTMRPWLWHAPAEPHSEAETGPVRLSQTDRLDRLETKIDRILELLTR